MSPRSSVDYEVEDQDCPYCGGEGFITSCCEDTCPAIGGEDGCADPMCMRPCEYCQ